MVLTAAILAGLLSKCGGNVDPTTLKTIISVESNYNPYVVANVTKGTSHYFNNENDAIEFVDGLANKGEKYSVGLGQVYVENFKSYGLTNKTAFNFCKNISVASKIYESCYYRAIQDGQYPNEQDALRAAASCYYSNNFTRGFKKEKNGMSYVDLANKAVNKIYSVPAMKPINSEEGEKLEVNNSLRRGVVYQKASDDISTNGNDSSDVKKVSSTWDVFHDFSK